MAIWDAANVEGKVRFPGIVEQATVMVPRMKAAGADVVVVSCHSGSTTSSSYGDALPYPENASRLLAEQVPDIDAILVGHAHVEVPQLKVTNTVTGREVLLSEPLYWGMRVSVMDLDLVRSGRGWRVKSSSSTLLNANTVPRTRDRGPGAPGAREGAHLRQQRHRHLHAGDVGLDLALPGHRGDGLHQPVQAETVKAALVGTPQEGAPGALDRGAVQQGRRDPGR